jgi:hypothetical protein
MKKKRLSKTFFLLAAVCQAAALSAQTASRYRAAVDTVARSSFYKIGLLPSLLANCEKDLRDIRIVENDNGRQIPYILKSDEAGFRESSFIGFPILTVRKESDKQTHIVIQANPDKIIDNLLLFIKNTDALRSVTLSGSDNQQNWFVIKENIYLDEYFRRVDDQFIQTVSFPPSKYGFYKITIIGENRLPVNIVKAGMYTEKMTEGKYQPVAIKSISQKDSSNKNTYVELLLDAPHFIHKLSIQPVGSKYFNRQLEIRSGQGEAVAYGTVFRLSSNGSSAFPLNNIKTNKITLIIHNEDNPPLKIQEIYGWQLNQYLLTYLDANKQYSIRFGDSTAKAPVYDLTFFKDSIPSVLPALNYGAIEKTTFSPPESKPANWNKTWMWLAIIIAALVLLFFTIQLARQINNKANDTL